MKKLTKDQKARMAMYSTVANALESQGIKILGKSKKGLVLEHGEVEIAVVIKKTPVTEYEPLETVEEYEEKYKAFVAEKAKEKAEEE